MSFTDRDFSGLDTVADIGLRKEAADYGNLPEMTTGNMLVDMGLYAVPFVGNAMAAGDAARNFADSISDIKRGKWLSAMGNVGSGALNTLWAIPGVGNAGKLITGLGARLLGRTGKSVARAAKGAGRGAQVAANAAAMKGMMRNAGNTFKGRAANWMLRNGRAINRYGNGLNKATPHLGFWKTMAGFTGAGVMTSVGDSMYDKKHQEWMNDLDQRQSQIRSYSPGARSYTPWSSISSQRPQSYSGMYGNPYGESNSPPYRRYA
jgi:hypothetical protein